MLLGQLVENSGINTKISATSTKIQNIIAENTSQQNGYPNLDDYSFQFTNNTK